MIRGYIFELDRTLNLYANDTAFYKEMICLLRWAIDIWRVDVLL